MHFSIIINRKTFHYHSLCHRGERGPPARLFHSSCQRQYIAAGSNTFTPCTVQHRNPSVSLAVFQNHRLSTYYYSNRQSPQKCCKNLLSFPVSLETFFRPGQRASVPISRVRDDRLAQRTNERGGPNGAAARGNLRKKVESSFPSFLFLSLLFKRMSYLKCHCFRAYLSGLSASFVHAEEIGQDMHEVALSLNEKFCLRGPSIRSANGGFIFDRLVKTLWYPLHVFL